MKRIVGTGDIQTIAVRRERGEVAVAIGVVRLMSAQWLERHVAECDERFRVDRCESSIDSYEPVEKTSETILVERCWGKTIQWRCRVQLAGPFDENCKRRSC